MVIMPTAADKLSTHPKTNHFQILSILLLLCLMALLTNGCAGKSRTELLLEQQYMQLSDDDLLLYFYQLNDEIEISENRSVGSNVSLGFGTGTWGHRAGIGYNTGGGHYVAARELRERRNLVRLELGRRNLTPR
jgi:hypothetical protein